MSATFSGCRTWRYVLSRTWPAANGARRLTAVLLNPSTADETRDDPTIRRVIGFAKTWGHNGLDLLNLFAYRATDPQELRRSRLDPVGPSNDAYLTSYLARARDTMQPVLAAWGAWPWIRERAFIVKHRLVDGVPWICLGRTSSGAPRHPLYVPADKLPEPFGH